MKVVHVSPTYFNEGSIIGGGERYVTELSLWTSRLVDTTLVTFSSRRASDRRGDLKLEVYPVRHLIHGNKVNPLSFRYLKAINGADVVHIHHVHTLVSDMACLVAAGLRKPAFVTDYGGGGSLVLNRRLPLLRFYRNAVAYSQFGVTSLEEVLRRKTVLIKGGIDTERFRPDERAVRENVVLFVGRILAHKGIDYLIEGFRLLDRRDYRLRIIGRVYNEDYYTYLKSAASGLDVEFVYDADDNRLLHEYRTARVTVLPSVHRTHDGAYTPVPELMGFTLLESQACGTPVVCSDAGAMKEFVDEGRTGFVVPQNSGEAIAGALSRICDASADRYAEYSRACAEWVLPLNWAEVAAQHVKLYQASLSQRSTR